MSGNGGKKNGKRRDSLDALSGRAEKLRDQLLAKMGLRRGPGGLESEGLPQARSATQGIPYGGDDSGPVHEAGMHGIGPICADLAPLAGANCTTKVPEKVETALTAPQRPDSGDGPLHAAGMHGIGPVYADLAPLAGGNCTTKVREKVETAPTAPKRPERRPPQFHPYVRGKICMALALGLSHREVEAWFDIGRSTIDRLVELDPTFAAEVETATAMVMLQPLLRIQKLSGQSWQAAAWLRDFLARRPGELPADELLGAYPELMLKLRKVLYPDEFLPPPEGRRHSQ